ncbi:MAG: 5-oxoprolinase subunit PxpB [Tissierellia bacterium]|jgi:KipI family sensor histidine kinase inhibitor|nr:5-oxoprolinase subunit PxpB [Tissierellia bacterium]MDD3225944.1 5-oxoprolinase subunit PxpB [Tissierellia bacterium]MDD3750989.1 5-oxoprolinase subunit PxpB [Tissierellia bacterium]MDD4046304.1 5-oxoprolinase subunit PxpB [Tissierellia bacterium]MDD4677773.1 5-oxoprolinase subunit PxpB [Tissierellia bacterium]
MYDKIKYLSAGDKAVVMEFGNEISKDINAKIRNVVKSVEEAKVDGIVELLPTYRSLMIMYDPLKIEYSELISTLDFMSSKQVDNEEEKIKIVEFPTVYGGEYGPDINFVAEHNNITVDEVIKIHTGTDYLVYMMGFTPGFTYLGGMSDKIVTPRLASPRTKIPAGSVGIAGAQTGMYPSETPGGWQLIGRTPLKLYDSDKEPPVMLSAGDYVRYVSVSEEEYLEIKKQVEEGTYVVKEIISEGGDLRE